jgi:hypothetical protein
VVEGDKEKRVQESQSATYQPQFEHTKIFKLWDIAQTMIWLKKFSLYN